MVGVTSLVIAGIGLGVSAYGVSQSIKGQKEMQRAQEEATAVQLRQEQKRQQQLNLDAMRRQREIVRQSIAGRSMALATTTAAGASGGSALPGSYGGVSGRSGVNALGVRQNQEIGNSMFGLNRELLGAYRNAAAGQTTASIGAGISSLGGALMSASQQIGRLSGGSGSSGGGSFQNSNPTVVGSLY